MRDPAGQVADRLHLLRLPQLLFRQLLLGDVELYADGAARLAILLEHEPAQAFEPAHGAVRQYGAERQPRVRTIVQRVLDLAFDHLPVFGMDGIQEGLERAAEGARLDAVEALERLGPVHPARPQVGLPHPHSDGFDDEVEAFPGLLEGGLCLALLAPLLGLAQLALDRGHEPVRAMLDDEIASAALEEIDGRFLGDGAGHDDAGQVRPLDGEDVQHVVCGHGGQ